MKHKILVVCLTLLVCGVVSSLVLTNTRLRSENNRLRSAQATEQAQASLATQMNYAPDPSSATPASATPEHPVTRLEKNSNPPATPSNFAVIRALWNNPQFRAASLERTRNDLEARYGRFFLTLKYLPPERLEAIKTMLATQSIDLAALSFPIEEPETPEAAKDRLAAHYSLQRTQDTETRAALGEDVFRQYMLAQQIEPYREMVSAMTNGMRSQGVMVNDDVQEKMLSTYAAAMVETAGIAQREDGKIDYDRLDAEGKRALRERQIQRTQLQLAKAMSGILDRDALDTFIAAQIARDYNP